MIIRMQQKERPVGLWAVSAFDALAVGLIPIWIVINWWYLNRKKTRDYFSLKPVDA
jgi:hypothetical protein